MTLAIYGAQGIALGTFRAIKYLYPRCEISCFLVTKAAENPSVLDGLPVTELSKYVEGMSDNQKNDLRVIIATPENVMPEIENNLESSGVYNHVRMTSKRWNELMSHAFAANDEFKPLVCAPVGCVEVKPEVLMAKFYKDKPLKTGYEIPEWIKPIQVGALLTDVRITDLLDSDGDNISEKNVNYSELTALYWMWKHRLSDDTSGKDNGQYYGLVHYRRIMELSKDDLKRLADNDIDVVLPYPMPYQPDIHEHHRRYIKEADWNAMLAALRELQPEYAESLDKIFGQQYLYNYNILLAKKNVLKEYCEWLFPILERTEELSEPKGSERSDRYIGYMGENLCTLYFMVNKNRFNIAHAGCLFLT